MSNNIFLKFILVILTFSFSNIVYSATPQDTSAPSRGSYQYDNYADEMNQHKMNREYKPVYGSKGLTPNSTWEEIRKDPDITIKNTWVRVGSINTNVFFVEQDGDMLYTKKPTSDGYYDKKGNSDNFEFVKTGESIKSGSVTISLPKYKTVDDDQIFLGREDYTQPLTRNLKVYRVFRQGNENESEVFLFEKEYSIDHKGMGETNYVYAPKK